MMFARLAFRVPLSGVRHLRGRGRTLHGLIKGVAARRHLSLEGLLRGGRVLGPGGQIRMREAHRGTRHRATGWGGSEGGGARRNRGRIGQGHIRRDSQESLIGEGLKIGGAPQQTHLPPEVGNLGALLGLSLTMDEGLGQAGGLTSTATQEKALKAISLLEGLREAFVPLVEGGGKKKTWESRSGQAVPAPADSGERRTASYGSTPEPGTTELSCSQWPQTCGAPTVVGDLAGQWNQRARRRKPAAC